ncbi:hypothetical protein JZ751_017310, partial [Albula glossodonta]
MQRVNIVSKGEGHGHISLAAAHLNTSRWTLEIETPKRKDSLAIWSAVTPSCCPLQKFLPPVEADETLALSEAWTWARDGLGRVLYFVLCNNGTLSEAQVSLLTVNSLTAIGLGQLVSLHGSGKPPSVKGEKKCLRPYTLWNTWLKRASIDEVETDVVEIEAKLDKLVKLCSGMIEAGKAYVSANKLFVGGIRDLSQQCKKDQMISECLEKCGESLQEIVNYHMILFDQAQRSVKQQLHNFVKDDVRKFKETKKQFDKVREDMEIAQVKNAQAPRNKPHEVEEAASTLTITRKCFRHLALDYVLQINVLQAKKKFEILDAMLSFMHAEYTLFHQGYNLLDEIEPYMKKLAAELDQLVIDSAMEKREMEHKHAVIQQRPHLHMNEPKLQPRASVLVPADGSVAICQSVASQVSPTTAHCSHKSGNRDGDAVQK